MLQDKPSQIDLDRDLRWSRRLSFVPRWGVLPTIRGQSVAEHCFHVARTTLWLFQFADPNIVKPHNHLDALELALRHDDEEAATGDHPSPRKELKHPTEMGNTEIIVKVADILEGMAFLHEETYMGNRHGVKEAKAYMLEKLNIYWKEFPWGSPTKPAPALMLRKYLDQIVSDTHPHPVLELVE